MIVTRTIVYMCTYKLYSLEPLLQPPLMWLHCGRSGNMHQMKLLCRNKGNIRNSNLVCSGFSRHNLWDYKDMPRAWSTGEEGGSIGWKDTAADVPRHVTRLARVEWWGANNETAHFLHPFCSSSILSHFQSDKSVVKYSISRRLTQVG